MQQWSGTCRLLQGGVVSTEGGVEAPLVQDRKEKEAKEKTREK